MGLGRMERAMREQCPLCSENVGMSRPLGPTTVVCANCSLAYNVELPTVVQSSSQFTERTFDPMVSEYNRSRFDFFAELWTLVWRLSGKHRGTVLDVGCGPGFLLEAATADGWTADGVDFSPEVCAAAQGRTRGVVRCLDIDDGRLPPYAYDLILMVDVLRHLRDPLESLKRCTLATKPGGAVVVRDLNIEHSISLRRFAASDRRDLQCLSPTTAREMFSRANLRDVMVVPSPMSLMTIPAMRRLPRTAYRMICRMANKGILLTHTVSRGRLRSLVPEMVVAGFSKSGG